jgi:hypothetical protein
MIHMKKYIFYLLMHTVALAVSAQTDSNSVIKSDSAQKSFVEISFTYQSQALEAGRTFNVSQFSLIPSVTYAHKSGLAVSATGNWLSESEPNYTLTTLSLGYSKKAGNYVTLSGSYARNIFYPDSLGLIKNIFTAGASYNRKWFTAGVNYSYLSGGETGHLLSLSTDGYWERECTRVIDVISINPAIAVIAGTATVPLTSFGKNTFEQGSRITWLQRRRQLNPRTTTEQTSGYQFGIMNLDFSIPVSVYKGKFTFTSSANYSVPFQLQEEEGTIVEPLFYFTVGILFTIQ